MNKYVKNVLAGFTLSMLIGQGTAFAEPRELSIATYLPAASTFVKQMLVPWADWINENSGDEFKVKVFAGGTLGRNPSQQDKIVKDGIADVAIIIPSRSPAEYPQFSIFQLPGFARSGPVGSEVMWSMYADETLPQVTGLNVLTMWMSDPYMVHSSEAINGLDDLKGRKFRAIGSTQTETMLALGAIPENVKITEAPEAITRGLLDGALADWSVASVFKITEVTQHTYDIPLGNLVFIIAMNEDTYSDLSDEGKALFVEAQKQWMSMLHEYLASQQKKVRNAKAEKGETVVDVTEADMALLLEATSHIREDVANRVGADLIDEYGRRLQLAEDGN